MKGRRPEEYEGLVRTVLLMLMLVSAYFIVRGGARFVSSPQVETKRERPCVIIDAGHGGVDPGKVSVDGALEKDINLAIAQKLQRFLQQQDVDAVLTRQSDAGLYDENASNKKVQDMKNRVALIEERQPVLTVSIHQNSYHEEYVHGAQVFYYANSTKSQELAEMIQQVMALELDKDNARKAKANDSYRDRGVRIFIQLRGGAEAVLGVVSGEGGLGHTYGDHAVFESGKMIRQRNELSGG